MPMMKMKRLDMLSSERHSLCMMANNHTLFSSLYENPLAAGAIAADLPVETACHDRLVGYLLRERLNSGSAVELATVASLPHVPPRACVELAAVASLPHVPPRACVEFSSVVSIPVIPPRA